MHNKYNLSRFLEAQNHSYLKALSEIKDGQKQSHWMWYIFPQLIGLGKSDTAKYYAIGGLEEAQAYASHPVLGKHLVEISEALLAINGKSALEMFGSPDDLKLRSSMTLFASLENTDTIFNKVLEKYFGGEKDRMTLQLIDKKEA